MCEWDGDVGVVDVVEHVPGHGPVLVLRGVGEHGPHQHDADHQEGDSHAAQRPLGLLGRRLLQSLDVPRVRPDSVAEPGSQGLGHDLLMRGVYGHCGQLHGVTQVGGDIHQGTRVILHNLTSHHEIKASCHHLGTEVGGAVAGAGILFRKEAAGAITHTGAGDWGGGLGHGPGI